MDAELYDVIIAGYGPVGQALALALGRRGHRVAVIEKFTTLYPLPRAAHIDDELVRFTRSLGCPDDVEDWAVPVDRYEWRNAAGDLLFLLEGGPPRMGCALDYLQHQPDLEERLQVAACTCPGITIQRGWEVVGVDPSADSVTVTARPAGRAGGAAPDEPPRRWRGKYLVGADGANSVVRRAAGIPWLDLGFVSEWLVVDFRVNDPLESHDMPPMGQLLDPARPSTLVGRAGRRHMRWEFMVLPGESAADLATPERIWSLIGRWVGPEDGEVIRSTFYAFYGRVARHWRQDRILLAGDAAHLMPPFLGQGLCSGMRDAGNLAWKLDLVLCEAAPDRLLDSYMQERRPHCAEIVAQSVEMGRLMCIVDPAAAEARDQALLAHGVQGMPPFPILQAGILDAPGGIRRAPAGTLSIQDEVEIEGRRALFDTVAGPGWTLIAWRQAPLIAPRHAELCRRLGIRWFSLGPPGSDWPVTDLRGSYQAWFERLGVAAVLVRPDFYLYGAVDSLDDLPDLLDRLAGQVLAGEGLLPEPASPLAWTPIPS